MIARTGRKERDRGDRKRKGGSFKFKYKARSADDVKKRAEQSGGNFDSPVRRGFDMWRPKSGENVIRILPPTWEDFEHYGYDVFMHRYVGSDSSNYICPNKMKGKACTMCDEAKELKAEGEEEEAKKMAFQKRVWVWVIDRDDKNSTPQVWDMSWSQDRDIAELSRYSSGKVLLIDHPDDGYDVIVKKTGSGKNGTKYHFNIERDSSPIDDDQDKQEEILKFISENPIPSVFQVFSNEHLEKKMAGTTADKDEDLDEDDEDDKKSKRRRSRDGDDDEDEKPKRRRGRSDEDEEDEEEDEKPKRRRGRSDEDEEDEEEDEKPKRRRGRSDEEDEEDEEDPPPRRRKRDEEDEDEADEDETPRRKRKPRDDEEDEEDEDEKPKRKKRARDDEEEDEDEEDDEEDEKPKRRRKRDDDDDEEDDRPRRRSRR